MRRVTSGKPPGEPTTNDDGGAISHYTRRQAGSAPSSLDDPFDDPLFDDGGEEAPREIVVEMQEGPTDEEKDKENKGGTSLRVVSHLLRRNAAGIIFSIPLLSTVIVIIRIMADRRQQSFEGTRLYRDVAFSSQEMMLAEYGLLITSVPFLLVLAWNLVELRTNWKTTEKLMRVDIYGRFLVFWGFSVPSIILFALFNRLEKTRDDERHRLVNEICFVIITTNDLVGFFILSSILVRIVHAEDMFMRPILCIALALGDAIYSILNVVADVEISLPKEQQFLLSLAQAFSSARYAVIVLGFLSLANIARNRLKFGIKLPFRTLDLVFGPALGISLFILSKVLSANHPPNYGSSDLLSQEWASFEILKTAYIIALLLFSLFFLVRAVAANREDLRVSEQKLDDVQTLTHRLQQEKALTVKLMSSMMPARIANDLSRGIAVPPEMYKFVVVFFSDIEGFTKFSRAHQPILIFDMLDRLYSVMDRCVTQFPSLYKVETIGDAYLVVGGLFHEDRESGDDNDDDYSTNWDVDDGDRATANDLCQFALIVNEAARTVPLTTYTSNISFVNIRIGVHAGECVAGLTGNINPRFCLFGDTINTAARMETTGITRRVHTSQSFASFISEGPFSKLYNLEKRSELVDVKGLGNMQTYFIEAAPSFDVHLAYADLFAEIAAMQSGGVGVGVRVGDGDGDGVGVGDGDGIGNGLPIQQQGQQPMEQAWQAKAVISRYLSTKHQGGDMVAHAPARPQPQPQLTRSLSSGFIDMMPDLSDAACPYSFEALLRPDFDVTQLRAVDDVSLCNAILSLFKGVLGALASVRVKEITFKRFLWSCRARYRSTDDVPYHNFFHSFCVVQFAASLLHVFVCAPQQLPKNDLFLVLLAALVHDIDHRGLNNSFHINSGSPLALLYNDISPLENHHAATTFQLLRLHNVLEKWTDADARRARNLLISCILATDMKQHGALTDALLLRATSAGAPFVLSVDADRVAFAELILHAADISNAVRPFHTSRIIVHDLAREFALQVAEEARLGMPSLPFMVLPDERAVASAETGFLQHCARPYFVALQACLDRMPQQASLGTDTDTGETGRCSVGALVAVLDDNVAQWRAVAASEQHSPSDA